MTRFFGKVGYVTPTRSGGVVKDVATEREYYGDEVKNTRYFKQGESILGESSVQTRISIMADAFALGNYRDIRYVMWEGVPMVVESVVSERPRLILLLGDKYNGKRP